MAVLFKVLLIIPVNPTATIMKIIRVKIPPVAVLY